VRDTGRGMTDEFLRLRLFKPFVTTKVAGLGVGLAQCRGIVEAHGGSIAVESRPGHGTLFQVRLPAAGPPSTGTPKATRVPPAAAPREVTR